MRTQITFEVYDEKLFREIEAEAKRQGLTKASFVRQIVFQRFYQNKEREFAGQSLNQGNTANSLYLKKREESHS